MEVDASARPDFLLAVRPMATQEKKLAKKMGRPATGQGHTIGVRFQPDLLAALDAFIAAQPQPVSRPEAIRGFVEAGLHLMKGEGE